MALLMFEGFDHLAASSPQLLLAQKTGWSMTGSGGSRDASLNGAGFAIGGSNTSTNLTFADGGNHTTLIVGFRYRAWQALGANTVMLLRDGGSTQIGLSLNSNNYLYVWRGTTATVLAIGTTKIEIGNIYGIELKVTFATGATGSYELRIDSATEVSGSSVQTASTGNSYATGITFLASAFGIGQTWDDLYLCDDTGGAPANDFLGSATKAFRIETLFPTTDDSVTFTPLSSTNVSNVDETAVDSDTTYNYSTNKGDIDTFNHGSLAYTPIDIIGVAINAFARKDDLTAETVRTKLKSGATTANGAGTLMRSSYVGSQDFWVTDPNTAAAWSATNVNATKIGYENV